MKLYLNELAPWEEKKEYHNQIQLRKDIKSQIGFIKDAIYKQTNIKLASSSSVIASQERIKEGLYNVEDSLGNLTSVTEKGFDELSDGLQGLRESFEWGLSDIVWQLEQNRKVLLDILEVLMAPLDTQAKELKRRAEEAYRNAWYDDALEDFLESEKKNKYDFSVHISIGMIYLFHRVDKKKALDAFEKAIKYATPKSQYYASYALLYKALIMRDMGKIDRAAAITQEAIDLSPNFAEAYYQNAQYNSQLKNTCKSLESLNKAFQLNINYTFKAFDDAMFDPIRKDLNDFLENLKNEKCEWLQEKYQQANTIFQEHSYQLLKLQDFVSLLDKLTWITINDYSAFLKEHEASFQFLKRIKILIDRNSLIDLAEVNTSALEILFDLINNSSEKIKILNIGFKRLTTSLNYLFLNEKSFVDSQTMLEWTKGPVKTNSSYREVFNAVKRMNATKYAGYSDWRLPTRKEIDNLLESDWRKSHDKETDCIIKKRTFYNLFSLLDICEIPYYSDDSPRYDDETGGYGFWNAQYVTSEDLEERVSFFGLRVKEGFERKNKQYLLAVRDRKEDIEGLYGGWRYFQEQISEKLR